MPFFSPSLLYECKSAPHSPSPPQKKVKRKKKKESTEKKKLCKPNNENAQQKKGTDKGNLMASLCD